MGAERDDALDGLVEWVGGMRRPNIGKRREQYTKVERQLVKEFGIQQIPQHHLDGGSEVGLVIVKYVADSVLYIRCKYIL